MIKHLWGCLLLSGIFAAPILLSQPQNFSAAQIELPRQEHLSNVKSDLLVLLPGFIGCTDYCPVTLHKLSSVLNVLPDESVSVAFLNIITGTPHSVSMSYAKSIDKRFLGYTVTPDQTDVIYRGLGIRSDEFIGSVKNHPERVYLFGRSNSNRWILLTTHGTLPDVTSYSDQLRKLITKV